VVDEAARFEEKKSMGAITEATLPRDLSPWGMFLNADVIVQTIMLGLVFASIVTWTVLLAKGIEVSLAKKRARHTMAALAEARALHEAAKLATGRAHDVSQLISGALEEMELSSELPAEGIKERIALRLERVLAGARQRIGYGLGVLATIGATAPFVGLFGTVWGIMNSFIGISKAQTTNLAVVAPGIAEALLATAIGLVAAIPAVVIYNLFSRWIAGYRAQLGDAAADVQRLASRDLDRRRHPLRIAAQ
jgi:biopolymer transport protein ExbB